MSEWLYCGPSVGHMKGAAMRRGHIGFEVPSGRFVHYGFAIPSGSEPPEERPWIEVWWEGAPGKVEVRLAAVAGGGEIACRGLRLGAHDDDDEPGFSLSARNLREIPLNDILIGALRLSAAQGMLGFAPADPEEVSAAQRAFGDLRRPVRMSEALLGRDPRPYRAPRLRPGRKGWPREHFERIAQEYNQIAAHNPPDPMAELARRQDKPLATVRRWVQRAQEMGIPVNRLRPSKTQREHQALVTKVQFALVFKGMSEGEALEWLERECGQESPPDRSLFDAPSEPLQDLLSELSQRPYVDLPDQAEGEEQP